MSVNGPTGSDMATGLSCAMVSACHTFAKGEGWKAFVSEKTGGKTWALTDPNSALGYRGGAEVLFTRDQLSAWATEYGLSRLREELAAIDGLPPKVKAAGKNWPEQPKPEEKQQSLPLAAE